MFTTFYPPYSFGGDAVGIRRMAQALCARGHEVTVVHDETAFLSLGGQLPAETRSSDQIRTIGLRSRTGPLSILMTQQIGRPVNHAARLKEIVKQSTYDIVWHNNISLIGGPGLIDYGTGLRVYEAHEHWLVCPTHVLWRYGRELCERRECFRCALSYRRPPQLWRTTGFLDRQLDKIDLLIAKSTFSQAKHREFGLRHEMDVLPYFLPEIDVDHVRPHQGHGRPYFLFVGRLEKIKGLQDVIPAMTRVPEADLLVIGDGDYAKTLKAQATNNPQIKFLGRLHPDELTAYYRGALGLIVPSVCYETFGIILIESFRIGTPVIARRIGPFPEIVEAANAGALFDTEDQLVSAMFALLRNPDLRALQSVAARAAFLTRWSEDEVLTAYGDALARAAHRKGNRALASALEAGSFQNGAGRV
ncbi:glycosyltransferase family 4 protein [Pseudoruegeria sp. SK021]|uniref:glycosyltransferase family 4 protein n=1 Tax=Pseudoruegeria sp. SK021 TaxID=1933035 RepID=UPI000A32134C|nr:glycosyltransferase family 4 protein [Pseudoruegeria sp. SK021]